MTTRLPRASLLAMNHLLCALGLALATAPDIAQHDPPALPELAPPFLVEADGRPIELEAGHGAPFVVDYDGDGLPDLAVGQFGGGTCRLYRNVGTASAPEFASFVLLQADGKPAAMESS